VVDLLVGLAREQGATVVLVTHDARVAAYADRVVMVRDGLVSFDLGAAESSAARHAASPASVAADTRAKAGH
jgi:ABC-type lipoprotein export system ATPase subunit